MGKGCSACSSASNSSAAYGASSNSGSGYSGGKYGGTNYSGGKYAGANYASSNYGVGNYGKGFTNLTNNNNNLSNYSRNDLGSKLLSMPYNSQFTPLALIDDEETAKKKRIMNYGLNYNNKDNSEFNNLSYMLFSSIKLPNFEVNLKPSLNDLLKK
jgi:hypothetical protein